MSINQDGNNNEQNQQTKQADLIFESATVYTVDTKDAEAQAGAEKDGKIVYMGNDAGHKTWRD